MERINVQIGVGPAVALKRHEGLSYTPTHPYLVSEVSVGVQEKLEGTKVPMFFRGSGPGGEIGYKLIVGNLHNQRSQSHQFELKGLWRQNFSKNLFFLIKGGFNLGGNRLNFGTGTRPDFSFGMQVNAEIFLGGEFPVKDLTHLFIFGGYQLQNSVIGEAGFFEHGPIFGVGVGFDVGKKSRKFRTMEGSL